MTTWARREYTDVAELRGPLLIVRGVAEVGCMRNSSCASARKCVVVRRCCPRRGGGPKFDTYLSDSEQAEIQADCSQLLLILAETEAQSTSSGKPLEKEQYLRRALGYLEQARGLAAPVRAFHLRRARYLTLLGDTKEAARDEQAAQAAGLDDIFDHFLMADELYRRSSLPRRSRFDRVLERKPGHFWARYLNALCLLRQQRPAEARALLSACLASRPDFVWLYLLRGFAHQELEAWAAADSDFEHCSQMVLDGRPRYVLLVNRGVLRVRTNRIGDAITDFEGSDCASRAPIRRTSTWRKRTAEDKLELRVGELRRAAGLEPGLAHIYRLQSRLYLERDEPDLALKSLDQAIEREAPNSPYQVDDHIERGRLLVAQGTKRPGA